MFTSKKNKYYVQIVDGEVFIRVKHDYHPKKKGKAKKYSLANLWKVRKGAKLTISDFAEQDSFHLKAYMADYYHHIMPIAPHIDRTPPLPAKEALKNIFPNIDFAINIQE